MALTKVNKFSEWFFSSSIMTFSIIIALTLISTFPLTSSSVSQAEVDNTSNTVALKADDYRILKAMMDRCVEIYLDRSSPQPDNLREDESGVKELNMDRCEHFFYLVSHSDGRFSPEFVHRLKVDVPKKIRKIGGFFVLKPPFDLDDSHDTRDVRGISDEDRRILKPIMDACVKLFLDTDTADWEKNYSDISFCNDYFSYMAMFYGWDEKLAPEYVETMKEFPKLYMLDRNEQLFQRCLIYEKHGHGRHRRSCNRLRKWRFQRVYTDQPVFISYM